MLSNQPAAEKHPKSTWLNGVVNRFEVYCRIPKVSNSPLSFRAHAACTAWLDSATANRRVGRSRRIAAITQPNPHQIAHFWSAMTCHRFGFSWADRLPMSFGARKAISRRFNLERLSPRRFLMSPTFPRDNRMIRFFEPISIGRGWATSFRRTRRLIASRGRRCHPIGTPNRSLTEC